MSKKLPNKVSIAISDFLFGVRLFVAERTNEYRYNGSMLFAESRGFPMSRVKYPDGKLSVEMPIGNAVDYARLFGGKVVKPDHK